MYMCTYVRVKDSYEMGFVPALTSLQMHERERERESYCRYEKGKPIHVILSLAR